MYARILVPVDDSPAALAGLREALRLARAGGGQVRLLHAVGTRPHLSETIAFEEAPEEFASETLDRGAALLARLRDEGAAGEVAVDTVLLERAGRPLHELVNEQAQAWKAELLVLGTHGRRGMRRLVAGSAAEQVVRHAEVPVLLVRCDDEPADAGGLQSIAAAIA